MRLNDFDVDDWAVFWTCFGVDFDIGVCKNTARLSFKEIKEYQTKKCLHTFPLFCLKVVSEFSTTLIRDKFPLVKYLDSSSLSSPLDESSDELDSAFFSGRVFLACSVGNKETCFSKIYYKQPRQKIFVKHWSIYRKKTKRNKRKTNK